MQPVRAWGFVLCLAVLAPIAGCLQDDIDSSGPFPAGTPAGSPRPTVVAVIDTGIDPYHVAFAASTDGVEDYSDLVPSAIPFNLSANGTDTPPSSDEARWDAIEEGQLYAFNGTRVFGISFLPNPIGPLLLDPTGHGTLTAGLALREDPNALIVAVQIQDTICDLNRPREDCPIFPQMAMGVAWAAQQPWIDVISVSMAKPGNPPLHPAIDPDMQPLLDATRRAHDAGKVVVFGAGNSVTPPLASHFAGPPWIVSVGGAEPGRGGEAISSSKVTDVVANYTDYVVAAGTRDGYRWSAGTSLATPIVAGTLSKAIFHIRQASPEGKPPAEEGAGPIAGWPDFDRVALRAALNATAIHFAPTDWNPTGHTSNDTRYDDPALPVVLPMAQQGWGYVHAGLATEIARRVLQNDLEPPPEKATTAQYQAQVQALREEYWSRFG